MTLPSQNFHRKNHTWRFSIGVTVLAVLAITLPFSALAEEEPPQTVNEAAEDTNTVDLGDINDSSSFSVSDILKTTGQNQEYLNDPSGNAPLVAAILDVIEFIIRIVGAIAILLIILGGLYMIISEGSEDRLEKGKTILTSAIIGLVISMFSYLIVRFVQSIFY